MKYRLLRSPQNRVFQGDYLEIIDSTASGSVVVQVYDEMYIQSQSLTEDIIRDQIIEAATGTALRSL